MADQNNEIVRALGRISGHVEWTSVALIVLAGAGIRGCYNEGRIADSLENRSKQEIQMRDVLGDEQPEKFYDFNGQRTYLEIDGKPVESYFPQKPIPGGIR